MNTIRFKAMAVNGSTMAVEVLARQHNNNNDSELLVAKIVAIIVLIVVTSLMGSLPYLLNRWFKWTKSSSLDARSSTVIRCLLYFGGGVLICTAFLHMLPDVIEIVGQLQKCNIFEPTPFALPELLMCTGFFLMYLLDQIMRTFVLRHQKKLSKKEAVASAAFHRGYSTKSRNSQTSEVNIVEEESRQHHHDPGHSHSHLPVIKSDDSIGTSMRGLGIILALSLHELFEGIAIGLQSTVGTVWFMFAAVAAHKLVLAFCVGMELLVARTRPALAIIYLITFSIVTPIGIGVGIGISGSSDESEPSVASGILQGIATGTLLYVVFFEIFTANHSGWRAYFATLFGFTLMFGLQILSDEAEGADPQICSPIEMD